MFWIFLAPSLLLRLRHLAPPPPPNSRRCDRHAPWAQAQSELPSPSPGPAPNCSVWKACAAPAQSESGAASGLELVVSFCRVASVYDSSPSVLVAPHHYLLKLLVSWTTTPPNHDLEAHVTTAFTCPWQRIIITTVLALGSAKTPYDQDLDFPPLDCPLHLLATYTASVPSRAPDWNPTSSEQKFPIYKFLPQSRPGLPISF